MRKLVLVLVFLVSGSSGWAAPTDRYVTSSGSATYAASTSSSTPMSWVTALASASPGDRINVQVGTYSRTTNQENVGFAGTATLPIWVRGYSTTPGDGYIARSSSTSALDTTNMPVISYTTGRLNPGVGNYWIFESLNVTCQNTLACFSPASDVIITHCKVLQTGTSGTSIGLSTGTRNTIFDSDLESIPNTGTTCGAALAAATGRIFGCRIRTTSTAAAVTLSTGTGSVLYGNQVYTSGGIGISATSTGTSSVIMYNTIYGNAGDAISFTAASTGLQMLVGNMITDNTGEGINMGSTASPAFAAFNRTRDNASTSNSNGGYANGGEWILATKYGDVASGATGDTSTDYTNYGSGNVTIKYSSPATNAGFPAFQTIGALQPLALDPAASGPSAVTTGYIIGQ